jgi:hypothetical protein
LVAFVAAHQHFNRASSLKQSHTGCSKILQLRWRSQLSTLVAFVAAHQHFNRASSLKQSHTAVKSRSGVYSSQLRWRSQARRNFGGVRSSQLRWRSQLSTLVAFVAAHQHFNRASSLKQSHTGCSKISQLWWRLQLATSVAFAALNFGGVCGGTSAFQPGIVFEAVAYWLQ